LISLSIAFYDFPRREELKLAVERSFDQHSRKRNTYKFKGIQFPGVAFIDNRIYVIGGCDKEFKAYDSVYEGIIVSR
jgi:hypothetical protein